MTQLKRVQSLALGSTDFEWPLGLIKYIDVLLTKIANECGVIWAGARSACYI